MCYILKKNGMNETFLCCMRTHIHHTQVIDITIADDGVYML